MGDRTGIEWTDATWNPVTGCSKVSPGCDNCYAESIAHRFAGSKAYPNGFDVTLHPERLFQPFRWTRPRRVFVNSMSDLFHDEISNDYIASVFAVMALASEHTFQVLTKRHGRMRTLLNIPDFLTLVAKKALAMAEAAPGPPHLPEHLVVPPDGQSWWPLPNVWLGVSVEDQKWADIRVPALLDTPAAVRFLSCEPLLGRVDLEPEWLAPAVVAHWKPGYTPDQAAAVGLAEIGRAAARQLAAEMDEPEPAYVDWVIVGGESGPHARPMHPDWARSLRDGCTAAGVAFHFKQWGEWVPYEDDAQPPFLRSQHGHLIDGHHLPAGLTEHEPIDGLWWPDPLQDAVLRRVGKKAAGRELDDRTWDEFPAAEVGASP